LKPIRTILSYVLAIIVMLSSMSFTINAHMCGGELKDLAVFTKATPCKKEAAKPSCHQEEGEENNCCKEQSFETEAQKLPVHNLKLQKVSTQLLLLYSYSFPQFNFSKGTVLDKINPFELSPPYKPVDIHILLQSFLI
jgi:hypothetical protein